MKLHADSFLPFPRAEVFRTYRDRLVELIPFLPNVRAIDVRSRKDDGTVSHIVNVWHGGGDIPKVVRSVLSENLLNWTDHAKWDEAAWTCEWRMETHSFPGALHAVGTNKFVEAPGGCKLIVEGDLAIDGSKLPVPRLLARTVAGAAESFLVAVVKPNLTETAKGVVRFLEAEARKRG